jgi:hypothetical protein
LFGNFDIPSAQPLAQWMMDCGKKMVKRGIFSQCPDQYRLCDWMGEFSGNFKWHTDNNHHGKKILATHGLLDFALKSVLNLSIDFI